MTGQKSARYTAAAPGIDSCGKVLFTSRRAARQARRTIPGGPGHLSIYLCRRNQGFHLGHLPDSVRHGDSDRQSYVDHVDQRDGNLQ